MNNDLISREALKSGAEKFVLKKLANGLSFVDLLTDDVIDKVRAFIDNAPTVEAEKTKESEIIKAYTKGFDTGVETVKNARPQGEWIISEYVDTRRGFITKCPFCKTDTIGGGNFCPNCGADMQKGGEDK